MAEEQPTDQPPHEAFLALGNELRVEILLALVEYERTSDNRTPVPFAKLRKRVGVQDPSKFNYHLKELLGHFVEKTDTGYRLNNAGRRVVSAVRSGELTPVPQNQSAETEIDCPSCQAPLVASYETDHFEVNCPNHGAIARLPLPRGVAMNRPIEELYNVASLCGDWYQKAVTNGICPLCWGEIDVTLPHRETPNFTDATAYAQIEEQPLAGFTCEGCWMSLYVPIGALAARDPAVTTLFFRNGIDLSTKSIFEINFIWARDTIAHISTNPTRVHLEICTEGEELRLVLDDRARVIHRERSNW